MTCCPGHLDWNGIGHDCTGRHGAGFIVLVHIWQALVRPPLIHCIKRSPFAIQAAVVQHLPSTDVGRKT